MDPQSNRGRRGRLLLVVLLLLLLYLLLTRGLRPPAELPMPTTPSPTAGTPA